MKKFLLVLLVSASNLLFAADLRDVGSLSFENSGAKAAQPHFLRGVGFLHSFGWKQAIREFKKAQQADADFALAYWGESLCYNHPLIGEWNRQTPMDILQRLGATPEVRLAKAGTPREKGFIKAVEALFNGPGDIAERRIAYKDAMQAHYAQFPDDDEVAAFYALSLLSAARASGDDLMKMNILAGSIATRLFKRNKNHPGAAHYVIHSFDDPLHAPLALEAAQKFAQIAPAVSHARHMPTHIFIQHGMWPDVSTSNQSAYDAAKDLWEPGDAVGDMVHALDWGQYGDLQQGDYEKAQLWITRLESIAEQNEGQEGSLEKVRARYVVETEDWQIMAVSDQSTAASLLAAGLSAIHLDDLKAAENAKELLAAKVVAMEKRGKGAYREGPVPTKIMYQEIAALVSLAEGDEAQALVLLEEGVELTKQLPPPNGTANPIKPVHELYAEVLSGLGRFDQSIALFNGSLARTPNRSRSLLGLARTYAKLGDEEAAAQLYRRLAEIRKGSNTKDLQEAEQYLSMAQL